MSDYDMQDVKLLPNEPLTASKVVVSSTAKLDFDVKLDNFVQVDQGRSMDTATVQSVEYSETACECCLCKTPEFVIIPEVSCHALSTNSPDQALYPVVTLNGQKLVNG